MEYAGKQQNKSKASSQKAQSFFGRKTEPAFFAPLHIQPKLTIGPVDDRYEREADAVADKVMRTTDVEVLQQKSSPIIIHRKCDACEKEDALQSKAHDTFIQRSPGDDSANSDVPVRWGEDNPAPYLKIQVTILPGENAVDMVNYGEANLELIQRGKINPSEYAIPYAALWNTNYQLSTSWRLGTITRNLYDKGDALLKPIRGLVKKIPLAGGFLSSKVKLDKPDLKGGDWDRYVADKLTLTGLGGALDRDNPSYNAGSGFIFTVNIVDIPFDENNIVRRLFRKPGNHNNNLIAPSIVNDVINTRGQSLEAGTKNFMEARFGYDFENVQIHDDSLAHKSSAAINALAYTHGRHIVFAEGQYQPASNSGKQLLAHELAHVVQQSSMIRPYRSKKDFNFGVADKGNLIEDSFTIKKDKETKPWIELVTVKLTSKQTDTYGSNFWVGSGVAKYYNNPVKLPDISLNTTAGSEELGKTTGGTYTVKRIEGIGYNSGKYSGTFVRAAKKGWGRRYSKDLAGNMNFAVFFHGGEALHSGPADESSHGCVHVDWTDETNMQQLNYHSVIDLTKVEIKYP